MLTKFIQASQDITVHQLAIDFSECLFPYYTRFRQGEDLHLQKHKNEKLKEGLQATVAG